MIKKTLRKNEQPWVVTSAVKAAASSEPVQEHDALTGTYYPDRTAVPLVLDPVVGWRDPVNGTSSQNAAAMLTDGHWYRLDNTTGGALTLANEISSGTTFVIDTVAGSATYGRLTVKENVLPGNPVTYVFRCTLPTPAGNETLVMSWRARAHETETFPVLTLDNLAESTYDPLNDTGAWTLNPVLKPAVAGATFAWETCHDGVWGALDSTHYDWAIEAVGDGISIDRKVMPDQLLFRCRCDYTLRGKAMTEYVTGSVTRRIPKHEDDFTGVTSISDGMKTVSPKAVIRLGDRILADPKGELVVIWCNGSGTELARGMNPVLNVSQLGASLEIGMEVKDPGGFKALETNNGANYLTVDGKVLILR